MESLFSPSTPASPKALAALRAEMAGKISLLDMAKDVIQISRGMVL